MDLQPGMMTRTPKIRIIKNHRNDREGEELRSGQVARVMILESPELPAGFEWWGTDNALILILSTIKGSIAKA